MTKGQILEKWLKECLLDQGKTLHFDTIGKIEEAMQEYANQEKAKAEHLDFMLNSLLQNRPLYRDSGSWQIRSDSMEEVLYKQGANERFYDFIKRCFEAENEFKDMAKHE